MPKAVVEASDLQRSGTKKRMLNHALAIHSGPLPPGTPLDMSETIIKPLLLVWLSQWLNTPALKS